YAWVTLATNDSYSLGALVVAHSLKNVNTAHQTAVLITPGVSQSMKSKLEATFNVVVEVNVLDSKDAANLALLSRPELGITFTKLHCWRLTQFQKCVFLDADTLVLQNCDELFDREELSAAPDVGWPDCFNSGVFVFQPNLETFGKLIEFATRQGSFDGGDQGLLNSFFSDWASKDISKHLPFIYNTCSTACYSYLPAFKQFGKNVKILHFIGQVKPWLLNFDSSSKTAYAPSGYGHLGDFIQQWWNLFCDNVHPSLSTEMTTSAHPQNSDETQWYQNQHSQAPFLIPISSHSDPPQVKFIDPWDTYYETNIIHTDSQPHDCNIDANVVQIDDTVPCSNYHQNHESSHASHNIVGHCDDHQQNHKENANVDIQRTITAEPHISIRSSSVNEFNEIDSNPNLHQDSYNHVEDTSNHSININSFQTFNHDYSQANTSESPSIGCDVPKIDERDRDSYQSSNYDGDVEDETTLTVEEGGLAGALAQLTLGAPRSAEQQAYEDSMRRQCWESGNIDYLGKDSFDNIWKRITKTIETKSDTPPTEKYRSPTPQPEEKLAVGEKTEVNVGAPFKESEEDGLKTTPVKEEIVTEVTSDGRIIEKKIVTYPGEETTEIEEIEEVDGQTVSVKRSVVASESKDHQPKPAAELKNEP
ncbi:Glycogenin-1, partial [Pseudolycoriella hygida]